MTEKAQLRSDLTWREIDDKIIVLDLHSGKYLELNATGAALWKLLAEGAVAREELTQRLVSEFQVDDETATRDVEAFLSGLERARLLG
jgi:hypothetical protein